MVMILQTFRSIRKWETEKKWIDRNKWLVINDRRASLNHHPQMAMALIPSNCWWSFHSHRPFPHATSFPARSSLAETRKPLPSTLLKSVPLALGSAGWALKALTSEPEWVNQIGSVQPLGSSAEQPKSNFNHGIESSKENLSPLERSQTWPRRVKRGPI